MVYETVVELQPTIENRELLEALARKYGYQWSYELGDFLLRLFGRDDIERAFGSVENYLRQASTAAMDWFKREWPGAYFRGLVAAIKSGAKAA